MSKAIFTFLFSMFVVSAMAQLPGSAREVNPIKVGDTLTNARVQKTDGSSVLIRDLAKGTKSVLLFYRGGWCPYCNSHLAAVAELEAEILAMGYTIIAVSPDSPEELNNTMEKNRLNYSLVSDSRGDLSMEAGIAFQAAERQHEKLKKYSNGNNSGWLPVPAVIVIDKSGVVLFEYVNPNYKQRLDAGTLSCILRSL